MNKITLTSALLLWSTQGLADMQLSGSLGLQQNYFWDEPKFVDQKSNNSPEMIVEPEIRWRGGDHAISYKAFGREGSDDE